MHTRTLIQLFMMAFTSFHYNYFVKSAIPTVEYMMNKALTMSADDQLRLVAQLQKLA